MTTTRSDLQELILSLTHDQQRKLNVLLIWHEEPSGWMVRCSYASYRMPQEHVQSGGPTFASSRLADTMHYLTLDVDDPGADIVAMCQALEAVGTVGSLALTQYDLVTLIALDDSQLRMWTIVTHAGSDQERATWLRELSGGGIPPAVTSSA